jgi:hypothetical protein
VDGGDRLLAEGAMSYSVGIFGHPWSTLLLHGQRSQLIAETAGDSGALQIAQLQMAVRLLIIRGGWALPASSRKKSMGDSS